MMTLTITMIMTTTMITMTMKTTMMMMPIYLAVPTGRPTR